MESDHLSAYNASCLIPLDKSPGIRPIGISEVLRRIIGKVVTECVRQELLSAAGNIQFSCGQTAGIEHAVHSLRERFDHDDT